MTPGRVVVSLVMSLGAKLSLACGGKPQRTIGRPAVLVIVLKHVPVFFVAGLKQHGEMIMSVLILSVLIVCVKLTIPPKPALFMFVNIPTCLVIRPVMKLIVRPPMLRGKVQNLLTSLNISMLPTLVLTRRLRRRF